MTQQMTCLHPCLSVLTSVSFCSMQCHKLFLLCVRIYGSLEASSFPGITSGSSPHDAVHLAPANDGNRLLSPLLLLGSIEVQLLNESRARSSLFEGLPARLKCPFREPNGLTLKSDGQAPNKNL